MVELDSLGMNGSTRNNLTPKTIAGFGACFSVVIFGFLTFKLNFKFLNDPDFEVSVTIEQLNGDLAQVKALILAQAQAFFQFSHQELEQSTSMLLSSQRLPFSGGDLCQSVIIAYVSTREG